MTRDRDRLGDQVDHQPAAGASGRCRTTPASRPASDTPARARMSSSALFLDDADDVVDGDLADQPPARLDHRGGDQVVLVEDVGDLFLVHVDRDFGDRLHDLGQRRVALGAQQVADRRGAHRLVGRIDHIDVEEQLRQLVARRGAGGRWSGRRSRTAARPPPRAASGGRRSRPRRPAWSRWRPARRRAWRPAPGRACRPPGRRRRRRRRRTPARPAPWPGSPRARARGSPRGSRCRVRRGSRPGSRGRGAGPAPRGRRPRGSPSGRRRRPGAARPAARAAARRRRGRAASTTIVDVVGI